MFTMRREIDLVHVREVLVAIILADLQTHAVESCHSHDGIDDKKSQPPLSLFVEDFVISYANTIIATTASITSGVLRGTSDAQ